MRFMVTKWAVMTDKTIPFSVLDLALILKSSSARKGALRAKQSRWLRNAATTATGWQNITT